MIVGNFQEREHHDSCGTEFLQFHCDNFSLVYGQPTLFLGNCRYCTTEKRFNKMKN